LRALVYPTVSATNPMDYIFYGIDQGAATNQNPASTSWFQDAFMGECYVTLAYASCSDVAAVHGPILPCGVDKRWPGTFIWMDSGTTLKWTPASAAASYNLSLDKWTPGAVQKQVAIVNIPITSTVQVSMAVTSAGYYALRLMPAAVPAGGLISCGVTDLRVTYPASLLCFAHRTLPGWENAMNYVQSAAIIGLSLRFCNTTSDNFNGGQMVQYQLPRGAHWSDYIKSFNTLAAVRGVEPVDCKEGGFSYLKPVDSTSFLMRAETDIYAGKIAATYFDLDPPQPPLIIYGISGTPASFTGFFEIRSHVELLTTDGWRESCETQYTEDDWKLAMAVLAHAQQHYRNAVHWSQIWNTIKSGATDIAKGVVKYGPMVMEAAGWLAAL